MRAGAWVERCDVVRACAADQYNIGAGLHERSELAAQIMWCGRGRRLEHGWVPGP